MTKVLKGQSLLDIAIQETGSIENIFEIAYHNGLSITDELAVGYEVDIPADIDKSMKTVNYFSNLELKPASEPEPKKGGIGYMAVRIDFIVS